MMGVLRPWVFDEIDDAAPVALAGRWSSATVVNAAIGGYWSMAARYDADPAGLLGLISYLAHRVDVKDRSGRLAWQGMLTEVEVHERGYIYSYSLEDMANAVKAVYSTFDDEGEAALGYRAETDWATTADSITDYGRKEKVLSLTGAAEAQAELHRDRYLGLHARPLLVQKMSEEEVGRPYAWVRGRGYWWTSTWQVYNQSETGSRATNTQIEDIVSAACPLIASTDVVATGNSIERARDANQTAEQEIRRLLALGTSTNAALVAGVWADRELVVETMPTTPDYRRLRGGRFVTAEGATVAPWLLKAGKMLRLAEVVPGAATFTTELDDPRNVMIWQVAYQDDTAQASVTPLQARDLSGILLGALQPWG
jgi:hypothetical protein